MGWGVEVTGADAKRTGIVAGAAARAGAKEWRYEPGAEGAEEEAD